MFATGNFKRECNFWIRIKNECPFISDLAIDKLSAFCTTYLCEAASSAYARVGVENPPPKLDILQKLYYPGEED